LIDKKERRQEKNGSHSSVHAKNALATQRYFEEWKKQLLDIAEQQATG
jgi:hypothetical protein